jgi:transposase
MYPTDVQQVALLKQCGHARYVWNLAVEQWAMWTRDKGPTPAYVEQARQLTEARAAFDWLRAGSQTVQQQALRDFDQAVKNFYRGIHRRPRWRKAGRKDGFRIVGPQASRISQLNRRWAAVNVPKVGWVEKTSTDLARRFDVIRVEDLRIAQMTRRPKPRADAERTGRYLPNRRRAKAGLNRGILASGWGALVCRLEHKAADRVEKVSPAHTSQTCSACGHRAPENRKSQAVFRCVACGHQVNADVNAAVNIAAGRAVSARRETPVRASPKREPQLATSA